MPLPPLRHHPGSADDRNYFRVVVYAVDDGEERIVMEGTGTGHHAAVGYFDGEKVVSKHGRRRRQGPQVPGPNHHRLPHRLTLAGAKPIPDGVVAGRTSDSRRGVRAPLLE